jgi:hypothetical protein
VVELQEVTSLVFARRRRKIFERTLDFLHSPPQVKTICFFLCQMLQYIHIFYTQAKNNLFGLKMVPYIHILGFFWVKMVSYTHFFWGGGQNGAIYTFLEFNFFRKSGKKRKILMMSLCNIENKSIVKKIKIKYIEPNICFRKLSSLRFDYFQMAGPQIFSINQTMLML